MPSVPLAISTACASERSGIVIEVTSPASSVCPFSPISTSHHTTEDHQSDRSSDTSISPNLKFSFEDWHAPFNPGPHSSCEIEFNEEGSQTLLIPSSSPFYQPPPTPQFNSSFDSSADCSFPSVCPTLSSKFDLLHSHLPLMRTTTFNISGSLPATPGLDGENHVSSKETVIIADGSRDGVPSGHDIHVVVRDVVDLKTIPDFPEEARFNYLACTYSE